MYRTMLFHGEIASLNEAKGFGTVIIGTTKTLFYLKDGCRLSSFKRKGTIVLEFLRLDTPITPRIGERIICLRPHVSQAVHKWTTNQGYEDFVQKICGPDAEIPSVSTFAKNYLAEIAR